MKPILAISFNLILLIGAVQAQSFDSNVIQAESAEDITIDDALESFDFGEYSFEEGGETITYYLKNYSSKPENLVIFIQGTDPYPIFFYRESGDEFRVMKWFKSDDERLDSTYTYAIVAKPGLSGIRNRDGFTIPEEYHEKNYREYRVHQIDQAIEHIVENHLENPDKIILYGHSEGAQIAAAVATVNERITHLGFWSGNVLNNFYEFALFERIAALQGQQTDSVAHENIMGLFDWYQEIIEHPLSTELDNWGYTNRRWSSYEKAPLNDLLEVDIPVYAKFSTEDESTPIETAYLLPVQFMSHRKDNLTFSVCMNCDHSYREDVDGQMVDHWPDVFDEFIRWTDQ